MERETNFAKQTQTQMYSEKKLFTRKFSGTCAWMEYIIFLLFFLEEKH